MATSWGLTPGIVATTVLLAVAITETVPPSVVMQPETAEARFKLYFEGMNERMGNGFCKQLLEEGPQQRLEYRRHRPGDRHGQQHGGG
jgi:hypothetical protein